MPNGMLDTILGSLVQVIVFLWIVGFGFSFLGKHQQQYINWTKKTLKGLWDKQWKLIIGILIGWLLSYPGSVRLLIHQ